MKINQPFYGYVCFKDWITLPNGKSYKGYVGNVSIVKNKELVGFEASGRESNWCAVIQGHDQTHSALGCQIRCIGEWDSSAPIDSDFYVVKL